MSKIFVTSDWHFGHDRQFVWGPRGYQSVEEMNEVQIEKHNSIVTDEDDVYVLGDLTLGDSEKGLECIRQMKGKLHIVIGNHDTTNRIQKYGELPNVVEIVYATMVHYKKYHFYLSHFPTLTGNLEKESLKQMTLNLFGHTHQTANFYEDRPYMYHCGVDSHNGYPVLIDDIIVEMNDKVKECIEFLDVVDEHKCNCNGSCGGNCKCKNNSEA